ncbi:MAG: proteasome assembly chaperone 4 family protein [Bryobacteraceae bacterium]
MLPKWTETYGRVTLEAVPVPMGNDLCLVITGGDRPHLGAVALAQVRPSLEDSMKVSASTSVLTVPGHKEDLLARSAAQSLAARLNRTVVVCCGIHVDAILTDELCFVEEAIERLCAFVIEHDG